MDRSGENSVNLTPSLEGEFSSPEWSPDGTEIAFARHDRPNEAIYLMKSDGTNVRQLIKMDQLSRSRLLSWSPDGSRIVVATGLSVGTQHPGGLGVVNRDGSNLVFFPNVLATALDPDWSPWPDRQR